MKTEVGRNDTDDLYFTLAAENDVEETLLRLLVKGIRDQDLMGQILCAADTDEVKKIGGTMEAPVGISDVNKVAGYMTGKVFQDVQEKLELQQ